MKETLLRSYFPDIDHFQHHFPDIVPYLFPYTADHNLQFSYFLFTSLFISLVTSTPLGSWAFVH